MPRLIKRLASRATPGTVRLKSTNFPRYFILLQTGDYLLLQTGARLKKQRA